LEDVKIEQDAVHCDENFAAFSVCSRPFSPQYQDIAAHLIMSQVKLENLQCAGVIIGEKGKASIRKCQIRHLKTMAVEVREGGIVNMWRTIVSNCRQGVLAYAGARAVYIKECKFQTFSKEACLFDGGKMNPQTRAQAEVVQQFKVQPTSNIVAEGALEKARAQNMTGLLTVEVEDTTIRQAGNYGCTCDHGCTAIFQRCKITDCKQIGIYIKGGTDVQVQGCHIRDNIGNGIQVGYNYDGTVHCERCLFIGNGQDILEEIKLSKGLDTDMMRIWSKPIINTKNLFLKRISGMSAVPTVQELFAKVRRKGFIQNESHGTSQNVHNDFLLPYKKLLFLNNDQYYAIGNTFGKNAIQQNLSDFDDNATIQVLLAGVGDIRNCMETISEWWPKKKGEQNLVVTMNDISGSILVRNVLLLEMIAAGCQPETIANIWGSFALSKENKNVLSSFLANMSEISVDQPQWLTMPDCFQKEYYDTLCSWSQCMTSLADVVDFRKSEMHIANSIEKTEKALQGQGISLTAADKKHIGKYISTGSLCGGSELNSTLLEAPSLKNTLCYSSSIYRAICFGPLQQPGVYRNLISYLSQKFQILQEALSSGCVRIRLIKANIFDLRWEREREIIGQALVPKFDSIDMSNLGDYTEMLNCLILAAFLLADGGWVSLQTIRFKPGMDELTFVKEYCFCNMDFETINHATGLYMMSSEKSMAGHLNTSWQLKRGKQTKVPGWTVLDILSTCGGVFAPTVKEDDLTTAFNKLHTPVSMLQLAGFSPSLQRAICNLGSSTKVLSDLEISVEAENPQVLAFDAKVNHSYFFHVSQILWRAFPVCLCLVSKRHHAREAIFPEHRIYIFEHNVNTGIVEFAISSRILHAFRKSQVVLGAEVPVSMSNTGFVALGESCAMQLVRFSSICTPTVDADLISSMLLQQITEPYTKRTVTSSVETALQKEREDCWIKLGSAKRDGGVIIDMLLPLSAQNVRSYAQGCSVTFSAQAKGALVEFTHSTKFELKEGEPEKARLSSKIGIFSVFFKRVQTS